jgi:hypothetical protein
VRWAISDATRFVLDGRVFGTASAPVSIAAAARPGRNSVAITATEAAEVALHSAAKPARYTLDGKPAAFRFDAAPRLLRVKIPAGSHEIVYG